MDNQKNWPKAATNLLKSELAKRGINYRVLKTKLEKIGIKQEESAISMKISRGTFSLIFFLQCMQAIDAKVIHLEDII